MASEPPRNAAGMMEESKGGDNALNAANFIRNCESATID